MYSKEDLINHIKKLNIKPADTVIIHTSMKSIGNVIGGADTVLDAFIEYLKDGLFLVPTHTYKETRKTLIYDVKNSIPCVGIIPSLAIKRKEGKRSLHPTHSMMAFGKNAEEYIKGEETKQSPTPKNGCWARLADVDAKILLIGVGQDKNTFIHSIDEEYNKHRLSKEILPIKTIIGDKTINTPCRKFNHTKEDLSVSHNFNKFEKIFYEKGAIEYGKFGDAKVQVCSAKKIKEILEELIKENKDKDIFIDDKI